MSDNDIRKIFDQAQKQIAAIKRTMPGGTDEYQWTRAAHAADALVAYAKIIDAEFSRRASK